MGGDTEDVHPTRLDLHDEQHVQAPAEGGVDVEEVTRQEPGRLGAEEGSPGVARSLRCGRNVALPEDRANGSRRHGDAHPGKLTLDASVAPQRVFAGEA